MQGPLAWYIDEDLIDVYKVLIEARDFFDDIHGPLCGCGCPNRQVDDDVWAAEIGSRGWAVITHDSKILEKAHEREAFKSAGVGVFLFSESTHRSMHKWDRIRVVIHHWDSFERFWELEPRPFFSKFSRTQKPYRLTEYDDPH